MYVLCDFEHCMKKWIVLFARWYFRMLEIINCQKKSHFYVGFWLIRVRTLNYPSFSLYPLTRYSHLSPPIPFRTRIPNSPYFLNLLKWWRRRCYSSDTIVPILIVITSGKDGTTWNYMPALPIANWCGSCIKSVESFPNYVPCTCFITVTCVSETKKYLHTSILCTLWTSCLSTFRLYPSEHRNRCPRIRLKAVSTPCVDSAANAFSVKTSCSLMYGRSTRSASYVKETKSGTNSQMLYLLSPIYTNILLVPAFRIIIVSWVCHRKRQVFSTERFAQGKTL
jgi:hypothetical protein